MPLPFSGIRLVVDQHAPPGSVVAIDPDGCKHMPPEVRAGLGSKTPQERFATTVEWMGHNGYVAIAKDVNLERLGLPAGPEG